MKNLDILTQSLTSAELYNYFKNVLEHNTKYQFELMVEESDYACQLVGKAFVWSSTDEGLDYWDEIHTRLMQIENQ